MTIRKISSDAIDSGSITENLLHVAVSNKINSAYATANTATTTGSGSYDQANTARNQANAAYGQANNAYASANLAYAQANSARSEANTTFATVNTTFGTVNTNYQAAYAQANTARGTANDAYAAANTKLSTSGGSISGDLAITGNLTVTGNATTINVTNLSVNDSMILLSTNAVGDSNDIGFIGHFDRGATATHAGLIRKATENRFYLFDNYEVEPTNNVIDVAGNNFRVGNLRLGIINANSYVTSAGMDVTGQANAAYAQANAAYGQANSARSDANTTFATVNTTFATINTTTATMNTATSNRVLKAGDTMTGTLVVNASIAEIYARSSGGANGQILADGSNLYVGPVGAHGLRLQTNGTTRLLIDSSGNVGIGTTNPTTKLHVVGDVRFGAGSTGGSNAGNLYIAGNRLWRWIAGYSPDYGVGNGFGLYDDTGGAYRISVNTSGSVGIGTVDAKAVFQVGYSTYTGNGPGDIIRASSGGTTWIAADYNGQIAYFGSITDGTVKFAGYNYATGNNVDMILGQSSVYIKSSGNVGIGTTNPSGLWSGDERVLHLSSSGGTAAGLRISSVNASAEFFSSAGTVEWGLYSGTSSPFTVYTSGSHRLRIDSSGNMYLGLTGNPVGWGSAIKYAIKQASASAYTGFVSFASGNDHAIAVGHDGTKGMVGVSYASGSYTPLTFQTSGTDRITIATSGEVGIGSGSPSNKLDVIGNVLIQGTQGFNATDETASLYIGDSASEIRAVYDRGLDFYQNGTHRMRIQGSTGNVGIGTTNPSKSLQVHGTAKIGTGSTTSGNALTIAHSVNNQVNITHGSSTDWGLLLGFGDGSVSGNYHGTNHAAIINVVSGPLHLGTNNTSRLTIDSSGNVGIGTTSPSYKQHVEGISYNRGEIIRPTVYGGDNSGTSSTIGSYVLGAGKYWTVSSGAKYIHILLPSRYNSSTGASLMWCIEVKGYDFNAARIINLMIGGYVTPVSNGGPMSQIAAWDSAGSGVYSPTAYFSSNYSRGVARFYLSSSYYVSFTINTIASGNGDVIAPDELTIIESVNATI